MIEHWTTATDLTERATPFVVITMISSRGHVPQEVGAKAIITADGLVEGTVGGGKVEARAIEFARELLLDTDRNSPQLNSPQLQTWNLTHDIGMTCGGEATFLFEVHNPKKWKIAVFGAGHVSQALIRTLLNLDCHVTCVDNREDWLARIPESPKIKKILSKEAAAEVPGLGGDTFFVVMTQGHSTDLPVLEKIFLTFPDAHYVGVMGSDVKAKKIRRDLIERGVSGKNVDRLHSPIGLSLGGNRPYEIAISVTAELLNERSF